MTWVFLKKEDLNNNIDIFNICYTTYVSEDLNFWYNKNNFYNKYDIFLCYIDKKMNLIAAMVLVRYTFAFKIVLICHNKTQYAKQLLFDKLSNLLATPGFIAELSNKPSYIIQSRYNLKPILCKKSIEKLLDAKKRNISIVLNDNYNAMNILKGSYVYTKYKKNGNSKENLYGIGCPMNKSFVDLYLTPYECKKII